MSENFLAVSFYSYSFNLSKYYNSKLCTPVYFSTTINQSIQKLGHPSFWKIYHNFSIKNHQYCRQLVHCQMCLTTFLLLVSIAIHYMLVYIIIKNSTYPHVFQLQLISLLEKLDFLVYRFPVTIFISVLIIFSEIIKIFFSSFIIIQTSSFFF